MYVYCNIKCVLGTMLWSVFVSLQGAEWSWTSIGRLQNRYFVCVCMWLCVCVHVTLCACACDFVCVCVRAWCLLWVLLKSFLVQRDCSYSCCNRCSFERPRYQRYHVSTLHHTKQWTASELIPLFCSYVVNYDFPMHIEDYVHRVGRTGRAGYVRLILKLMSFIILSACLFS